MELTDKCAPEAIELAPDLPPHVIYPTKARREARRNRKLDTKHQAPKGRAEMRRAQLEQDELSLAADIQLAYADIMDR